MERNEILEKLKITENKIKKKSMKQIKKEMK